MLSQEIDFDRFAPDVSGGNHAVNRFARPPQSHQGSKWRDWILTEGSARSQSVEEIDNREWQEDQRSIPTQATECVDDLGWTSSIDEPAEQDQAGQRK